MTDPNAPPAPEASIDVGRACACFNIRRAARAITQIYDEAMRSTGLKPTQFSLLIAIRAGGELGIAKLSELLVMDRTTLTRNVKPLLKDGLIREVRGRDARVRAFALTGKGTQALEEAYPLWEEVQERVSKNLRREYFEMLSPLADEIVAMAGYEPAASLIEEPSQSKK